MVLELQTFYLPSTYNLQERPCTLFKWIFTVNL